MLLHYYCPQPIEQAVMALTFGFNYSNRTLEDNTINDHIIFPLRHIRKYGPLSAAQEEAIITIIERRITLNDALYADYKLAKQADKAANKAETWRDALQRWVTCIQAVRDLTALSTKYGYMDVDTYHIYRDGETDTEIFGYVVTTIFERPATRNICAEAPSLNSALKIETVTSSDSGLSNPPLAMAAQKPLTKRAPERDETKSRGVCVTTPATCHVCGHGTSRRSVPLHGLLRHK